jgi:hypothetical protein
LNLLNLLYNNIVFFFIYLIVTILSMINEEIFKYQPIYKWNFYCVLGNVITCVLLVVQFSFLIFGLHCNNTESV